MTIFVSPAERAPALLALGKVSSIPEAWGFDFCWSLDGKIAGIQRKSVVDFRASVHDGRLVKEVSQMQHDFVGLAIIIIEGINRWTSDGELYDEHSQYKESQHNGLLLSIQSRGIMILHTNDIAGTARVIKSTYEWSKKDKHVSLDVRPKAKSKWVVVDGKDLALHILQSFPTCGVGTSEIVWEYCDRTIPLKWKFDSMDDLRAIPGIGKVRAKAMWEALNPPDAVDGERGGGRNSQMSTKRVKEIISGD